MNSNQPRTPTADSLKRQATRLKKARGIRQYQALDIAAQEHGYANWRHFINSISLQSLTGDSPHTAQENYHNKTEIKLTAYLLENGTIQAQLSGGAFVSPPPLSRPQHPVMLSLQLNNNVWVTAAQKEAFWKELLSKRMAETILPRNNIF